MADQTQMNWPQRRTVGHDGRPEGPAQLRQDLGTLAHDVVTLGELQFELLREDVSDVLRQARGAAIVIGAAAVTALAALPVFFLGIAFLIAAAGIPLWAAMILVAGVILIVCGVAAGVSWSRLKKAEAPLERSQRELRMNLNWIKRALGSKRSDRSCASRAGGD